jgi:hypothetical protein
VRARAILLLLALLACGAAAATARPGVEETVHFEGTDRELRVYRMRGAEEGPALLVLGGIHGNEPGGYLGADLLLERVALYRGSLILVPRVNLASVLRGRRGVTGDMNRMFGPGDAPDPVIDRIEQLMEEADALLNLHDGWGFYRETWEDDSHNPKRFGQSIVTDGEAFTTPDGRTIELLAMAERVIEEANRYIPEEEYRFHALNTRTLDEDSPFPELRTSATYHALLHHGIPAFGVETSKNLPSDQMRMRHQFLILRAFLRELGLEEDPGWFPEQEERVEFVLIRTEDDALLAVRPGETVAAPQGAEVRIESVEGNLGPGVAVDVEGIGGLQDLGRPFRLESARKILVRKDANVVARMELRPGTRAQPAAPAPPPPRPARGGVEGFRVERNGEARFVRPEEVLEVAAGDRLRLLDVTGPGDPAAVAVDLIGFAGGSPGSPRDDRGYTIDTGFALLGRFSLLGRGEYYRVQARRGRRDAGAFYLRVLPPQLYHVEVERVPAGGGPARRERLSPEQTLRVSSGDTLRIVEARTSLRDPQGLIVNFRGFPGSPDGEDRGLPIRVDGDLLRRWALDPDGSLYEIVVSYHENPLGRVLVEVEDRKASGG